MSKTKKGSLTFLYSAPASSFHLSNGPTTYSEVQASHLEFILETRHPHPTSSPPCNPTSRYPSNTCRNPRSHQCMDYCHSFPSDSVSIFIHYNRSPPKARVTLLKCKSGHVTLLLKTPVTCHHLEGQSPSLHYGLGDSIRAGAHLHLHFVSTALPLTTLRALGLSCWPSGLLPLALTFPSS